MAKTKEKKTITLPVSAVFHADGTVDYEYRTFYVEDIARMWGLLPN